MAGTLEGNRAVVTGGGQGVGRGIALALAAEGAAVALVGRTEAKLRAVAAEIAKPGGTALPVVADVTQTLSRVAAAEWGPDGIRVITVLPAATSPAARAWRQANPAASYITGTTIAVDGGQAYLR